MRNDIISASCVFFLITCNLVLAKTSSDSSYAYIDGMYVQTVTDDGWMPFFRAGDRIIAQSHCVVISKPYYSNNRRIHNLQCADSFPKKFINPEGCILIAENEPSNIDGKTYKLECTVKGANKAVTQLQTLRSQSNKSELEEQRMIIKGRVKLMKK